MLTLHLKFDVDCQFVQNPKIVEFIEVFVDGVLHANACTRMCHLAYPTNEIFSTTPTTTIIIIIIIITIIVIMVINKRCFSGEHIALT